MALAQQVWERSRDYVVFGALLLVGIVIFVGRNGPALRAARAASLTVTAPVEGAFERAAQFRRSLVENERLRSETAQLSAEVARLREASAENAQLRSLLQFPDTTNTRRVVARVVAKDITEQTNLLTIDAGARDSIEVGMPVINERGIVGRVVLTSDRYSVVMPHQNTQFRVPAAIEALGREGVVRWDGAAFDRLTMEYVVKTEPVERGMLVVTSPFSGVFPAGIPVGRVDTAYAAAGRNDYVIHLDPAAPISEVGYVYVLLTRPDPEQAILEAAARDSLGIERQQAALEARLQATTPDE
ncbi:rod shape-determining protein MreC [Rubrivirga marina]|uniref:Cell shape-determining protein MreC n=1 Tax=Rubrivirga marina TaxID=1196024 RepID=A0A271J2S4_9BACT|nr:rod shape-determining protein MreC [Rubrivirga marina]PAP77597.1 rod shape-determining protein MreC [Rubrivirga marina]